MNSEVAKRFTEYRKASGLSQGAVAEKLGVSRQAVSKWERGDAVPDVDNFVALAELYNVSFNTLYFGHDNTPAPEPTVIYVEKPTEVAEAKAEAVKDTVEEAVEEAVEETVEETVEEAAEEIPEEILDENTAKADEAPSDNEDGKVKKIIKKIKKIKKTTTDNTAVADGVADIPAVALALSALALSGKSEKKLPYVIFAAAVVPVWHAVRHAMKKTKETCGAVGETAPEEETSFDEEIILDEASFEDGSDAE